MTSQDLFLPGVGGYHTYRIPALIATTAGSLLAFCEARRNHHRDSGDIDLLVRRSTDDGATWSEPTLIWGEPGNTCGNPCPVVDTTSGAIWLLATWNLGSDSESTIVRSMSTDVRHPYVMSSTDDGVSWSESRRISDTARRDDWEWYATGPGNGIQLRFGPRAGRLLIPANHSVAGVPNEDDDHHRSHVLYSDDGGANWDIGWIQPPRTNESALAELSDGSVLQAMRNWFGTNRRALSISNDGGITFNPIWLAAELDTPICQASLIFDRRRTHLHFASPRGQERSNLTVWTSADGGFSWPIARVVETGHASYSSMAMLDTGEIGLFYERGEQPVLTFTTLPSGDELDAPLESVR